MVVIAIDPCRGLSACCMMVGCGEILCYLDTEYEREREGGQTEEDRQQGQQKGETPGTLGITSSWNFEKYFTKKTFYHLTVQM